MQVYVIYIDDYGSRVKYQWIYSYIKRIFKKEKGSASQIMLRNNNNQKKKWIPEEYTNFEFFDIYY